MSTLLQLVNEVLRRAGQTEATTLASAQTPVVQTRDYLNETYVEMLQKLKTQRLVKTASFSTVAGTTQYTLASDADVDGLLADSLMETGSQLGLKETAYTFPLTHGITQTGRPAYFYKDGDTLALYPIPDGVYTIRYQYQVKPQPLTADNDTTQLPPEWEKAMILGTQARLEKFLGEGGDDTYLLYRDALLQLKSRSPYKPAYRMKGFYRGGRS